MFQGILILLLTQPVLALRLASIEGRERMRVDMAEPPGYCLRHIHLRLFVASNGSLG